MSVRRILLPFGPFPALERPYPLSDVAMTTAFGQADLRSFFVVTEEETAMHPEEHSH